MRQAKAISANVGLTVTDDSVLEMIEKREQAPRLPVMVMLEPEVKELAMRIFIWTARIRRRRWRRICCWGRRGGGGLRGESSGIHDEVWG